MIRNVRINGINYNVEDGVLLKDTATEELNSGTFRIANVEPIDIEPMLPVVIDFEDGTIIYGVVNTWVEEVATFDTELKNYVINFISETKKLERCQMPNTAITQPLNATKRTYKKYLNQTLNLFVKPVYPDVVASEELTSFMEGKIAVEEQFTTPNVKEYFNRILSKYNCLVTLNNNQLDYISINEKRNPIDESKLFFKNYSQQIEDYYSDIYTDVQNAEGEETITEIVGVRAPNDAVLTTENAIVELSHNIYKIKRVSVGAEFLYGTSEKRLQWYTIYSDEPQITTEGNYVTIKRVVEKSVYDYLSVTPFIPQDEINIKQGNIYYTRGKNTLEGLTFKESNWFTTLFGTEVAIQTILRLVHRDLNPNTTATLASDIRDLRFAVTYSTIDDVSIKFEKDRRTRSVLRDNQTDSIVDLNKFAEVQQEKINRLGNDSMIITARYDSLSDIPQLLDYIDDYVLAEREIVYHSDYVDFKGTLFKNYVKKNVYYGVDTKLRNTQLLPVSEAVTRKQVFKEKFRFSFEDDPTKDKRESTYLIAGLASIHYSAYDSIFQPVKLAKITSLCESAPPYSIEYRMNFDVKKAYTSIICNFKWYDNINVGARIGAQEIGGYSQEYIQYTNVYGELSYLLIQMYYNLTQDITLESYEDWTKNYPLVDNTLIDEKYKFYNNSLPIYKDNREIPNISLQFDFKTDDDIYINPRLLDIIPLIGLPQHNIGDDRALYIWVSTSEKYDKYNKDKVVESAVCQGDDNSFVVQNMTLKINDLVDFVSNNIYFNRIILYNNSSDIDLTEVKSWAIADANGNVYLAVNKRDTDDVIATTIYLNKED